MDYHEELHSHLSETIQKTKSILTCVMFSLDCIDEQLYILHYKILKINCVI